MRLIDADALKDKCYITVNGVTIGRNNYVMFHEIDDAPTLDAVNVVRCKNCKHWQKTNIETIDGEPIYDCPFCGEWADANGFCSFGERREK